MVAVRCSTGRFPLSGVQARSPVEALRLVRDFEEIRAWGRTPEHVERFAAEVGAEVLAFRRSR